MFGETKSRGFNIHVRIFIFYSSYYFFYKSGLNTYLPIGVVIDTKANLLKLFLIEG